MQQRLTPGIFYGCALAALAGLLSGLLLHAAWRKHPGGPQILLASPAAAVDRSRGDLADLDTGPVKPAPLPVTRLAPQMFDVQPAAEDEQRVGADDVVADAAPQDPRALVRDFN